MRRIRIKNDIFVKITVNKNGEKTSLLDKQLSVSLLVGNEPAIEIKDYSIINENIITFKFPAERQEILGSYDLLIEIIDESGNTSTLDKCNAFQLVPHSCKTGGLDGLNIETIIFEYSVDLAAFQNITSYEQLEDIPTINGIPLLGDITSAQLGLDLDVTKYKLNANAPVFREAPSSDTLTWEHEGNVIEFKAGDMCRVRNLQSENDYDLYILYGIDEDVATWVKVLWNVADILLDTVGNSTEHGMTQRAITSGFSSVINMIESQTLGSLANVDSNADDDTVSDVILVRDSESQKWVAKDVSEVGDGDITIVKEPAASTWSVRSLARTPIITEMSLGSLTNVSQEADNTFVEDKVLVLESGTNEWVVKSASDFGGGGAGSNYSIYLRNNMNGLSFASQQGEPCYIDITFVSQYRNDPTEDFQPTGENGTLTIQIQNLKYEEYTVVKQITVPSGKSTLIDVTEYLSSGITNVKLIAKGVNTGKETMPLVYSIQLTSLSVTASNFQWWTAKNTDFIVPLIIGGNVSKILHVSITGDDYSQTYDIPLGTASYTDTPYNYTVTHPGATGVYNASFYLTNADGTVTTRTYSVNFMCITEVGEEVKLMCVNNLAQSLTNWQSNDIFEYSIYDGVNRSTDATFIVKKDGVIVYQSVNDQITTSYKYTFTYSMEIDTVDNSNFEVDVLATSNGAGLIDPVTFPVNNSLNFGATTGAIFYMNPKTRSNTQTNYQKVINESTGKEIDVEWTNMNWGNDGWIIDSDGYSALKIFARSKAVIKYQPLLTEAASKGRTIELDFKVDNSTDTSKNIIQIVQNTVGLRISAENISFFSSSRQDPTTQDVPIDNGVRLRVHIVVMPSAYGVSQFNLVCIYINGKKNRQYDYQDNDYFANNGYIELGNNYSSLYVYGIRVYDYALSSEAVQKNYISMLDTVQQKQEEKEINDVLDSEGINIDYEQTKKKYNVFVFDKPFPNLNNPGTVNGTLEVYFKDRPQNNFVMTNLQMGGQGTSSMKYLEWNMRWKMKAIKDAEGNKINSIATYVDGTTDKNKVFFAEGVPKSGRLTAKKNWASSMQDHKAGSVTAYTDLFRELGLSNEATELDSNVRVAVYQEPFIGFSKTKNEEGKDIYTCMGEFTFGPDKGDKKCFGYDTVTFPNLLSVEGSDNAPLGALFRVPWNRNKWYWAYNADEEAFQYNEANCWDFDAGELNAEETEPISTDRWVDAYNAVYVCSNRIKPFNGTLTELNNQVMEYRSSGYEYWISKVGDANRYNLYYYESYEGKFIPSDIGNGPINLITQLSKYLTSDYQSFSDDQLNEMFIQARIALFRDTAPKYFDITDACYHHNFTELFAGTDQRAKNTYPYNFCTSPDSLWKWRLDDADTILPIDNQGQDRKPYYCEMHDQYDNGQPIWNGETSVFWNMLELAFPESLATGMKNMLSAMESLSGISVGTPYDKVYGFYQKYFIGIKNYFPSTLVNADAKRYEMAKIQYNNGSYTNDTDPITQSHGDFYSAETAWMKKRIMYIMSKYNYGLFSASGNDTIIVRAAGDLINYEITPAFDMYPAIANGTSIVKGSRTKARETCLITVDLGGSADQQNAIEGASWLLSIGEWHNKNVSGTMIVRGKRLTELNIGSKTEPIVISITGLTISDCSSLMILNVSNVSTLQGTLDLSNCENIREIYAAGTSLTQIKLPNGGGLELIEYPRNNKYITLKNFPVIANTGIMMDQCKDIVTDILIEHCDNLSSLQVISDVIKSQIEQGDNHNLKRIRILGIDETYDGVEAIDLLSNLTDGTYVGLNADGVAGDDEPLPVLEGKVVINSDYYEDTVNALRDTFYRLDIQLNGNKAIRFRDPLVLDILLKNKVFADYDGSSAGSLRYIDTNGNKMITYEEAANVATLSNREDLNSSIFVNTDIEYFEELQYFVNLKRSNGGFEKCKKLKRVIVPAVENIGSQCKDTYSLEYIIFSEGTIIIREAPVGGSFLNEIIDIPGTVTQFADGMGQNHKSRYILRPNEVISMGGTCGYNNKSIFYVPDNLVDRYKVASYWENVKNNILPMSEFNDIVMLPAKGWMLEDKVLLENVYKYDLDYEVISGPGHLEGNYLVADKYNQVITVRGTKKDGSQSNTAQFMRCLNLMRNVELNVSDNQITYSSSPYFYTIEVIVEGSFNINLKYVGKMAVLNSNRELVANYGGGNNVSISLPSTAYSMLIQFAYYENKVIITDTDVNKVLFEGLDFTTFR